MFVVLVLDGRWVSLPSGLPDGGQEVLDIARFFTGRLAPFRF